MTSLFYRTSILHCKSKKDFLAKLYGVRKAFDVGTRFHFSAHVPLPLFLHQTLLQSHDIRCYMAESGKNLVTAILKWAKEVREGVGKGGGGGGESFSGPN